jgi:hypothetical protein
MVQGVPTPHSYTSTTLWIGNATSKTICGDIVKLMSRQFTGTYNMIIRWQQRCTSSMNTEKMIGSSDA